MKRLFVFAFVMVMTMAASAQITWNAKLGGGIAMCAGENGDGDMKGKFVGKAGFGLEYPISANFSLMPSLEVAMKGTKWKGKISNLGSQRETYSPIYLQIPVLGAYRFNLNDDWNLTLKAGPYVAYGISGKVKVDGHGGSADGDMFSDLEAKRFDAGVDAGVDFEYHRLVFGLEYERGFVSFAPSYVDENIFNQAVYVTIGYKF
jgi:hypothetical protein